jgi:hypothetical protein
MGETLRRICLEAFAATELNKVLLGRQPHQGIKILQCFRNWLCSYLQGAVKTDDLVCCGPAFMPLPGWDCDELPTNTVGWRSQGIVEFELGYLFHAVQWIVTVMYSLTKSLPLCWSSSGVTIFLLLLSWCNLCMWLSWLISHIHCTVKEATDTITSEQHQQTGCLHIKLYMAATNQCTWTCYTASNRQPRSTSMIPWPRLLPRLAGSPPDA